MIADVRPPVARLQSVGFLSVACPSIASPWRIGVS